MGQRGTRKEDHGAARIAEAVTNRAGEILRNFRTEIMAMPEIVAQKQAARASHPRWEYYITRLARAAIAGEDILPITNEFNRLYVFPLRERKERNR